MQRGIFLFKSQRRFPFIQNTQIFTMIPNPHISSQYQELPDTNPNFLMDIWEKFLSENPRKKIYVLYAVIVLLVVLPPIFIRNEQSYSLYGNLSTFIWSGLASTILFYTAWHSRKRSRRLAMAWLAIAFSIFFFTLGNAFWLGLVNFLGVDPYPSIADFFFLTSYPLLLLGILLIPYKKNGLMEKVRVYLETVTVVISMGLFLWFFMLKPALLQTNTVDSNQLWVTLTYFSMDTLLFMAIWVLVTHRSSFLGFVSKFQLGVGILFLFLADTLFIVKDLQGVYFEIVRITDILYCFSYISIAMAGLQQTSSSFISMRQRRKKRIQLLSNFHRGFSNFLLFASFYLFVVGHEKNQLISFGAVSFWVGCLILISILLQRLDGHEISLLNEDLRKFNSDLEERVKQRTSELTVTNASLEKAMRAKDEFMAAMSHELRTPLTGILGGAESLKFSTYGELNEKQHRAVGLIEKSGHRLLSLINDLIDYSRLQSDMFDLFEAHYSLAEICNAALKSVEPEFIQKQQRVSFQIAPKIIDLKTDVIIAKKMLIHLLKNASKFTPVGGEFGISVVGNNEAQKIEITVWDKGIGIKEHDIHEIFTPFVQLDAVLARQYEGTGLGLAIVNKMVALLKGKIHVISTPGEGSSFIISLPWQSQLE